MSVYKFFKPAGATVESDEIVRLSDGTRVPSWVLIAAPIVKTRVSGVTSKRDTRKRFVDAVTGVISTTRRSPALNDLVGGFSTAYDVSGFSRSIDLNALQLAIASALTDVSSTTEDEIDPGFYEIVGQRVTETDFVLGDDYDGEDTYPLGSRDLRDYLVKGRAPQTLSDTEYSTRDEVVAALGHLAVNVVDRVNGVGSALPFIIDSGYVQPRSYSPDSESRRGESVRLEFSGTVEQVYLKAKAIAAALPFDTLSLDYRSSGPPLVTVTLARGSQRRRLRTRYDDRVVSDGRLLNTSASVTVSEATSLDDDELSDVYHDVNDDYSQLVGALMSAPSVFGGMANVASILKKMGVNPNPLVNPGAGGVSPAVAGSGEVRNTLSQSMTCPEQKTDPKLFPTASNPSLRRVSDASQLDDSDTQDALPFALRANNPLKVKKIPGVTDLKTRFGYLGEAEGIAVYQDHVGGAAAGMNYVMSTSAGQTLASATRSLAGSAVGRDDRTATKEVDDVTSLSAGQLFESVGKHVFGVSDPTGVAAQCATVQPDSMESMIAYCAAVAKVMCGGETSPLTHDEWASAYQIAKNQPNEHLKKATTGATLPVTEEANTVDTGVMTASQAKDSRNTVDYDKRAKRETWNPITNYPHYANTWGANGSNWIARGVVTYAQKTSNTDTTKMAKFYETEKLNQKPKNPTNEVVLPWRVKTG